MMAISPEEFMLQFPELAECDRHQIERALIQSGIECPVKIYGDRHQEAVANLAAHKLAMQYFQSGAIAGAAVEASKGGTPSLPKVGGGNASNLSSTSYGQEVLRIQSQLPICGFIA
jgi:Protein of unknown function (DUF4054)